MISFKNENLTKKADKSLEPVDVLLQVIVEIKKLDSVSVITERVFMEQEVTYFTLKREETKVSRSSFASSHESSHETSHVTSKDFFEKLSEYIQATSRQLHLRITTFHKVLQKAMEH